MSIYWDANDSLKRVVNVAEFISVYVQSFDIIFIIAKFTTMVMNFSLYILFFVYPNQT